MPLSPFHRTSLTTVLALVAAAMIVTGAPPDEAAALSAQAAVATRPRMAEKVVNTALQPEPQKATVHHDAQTDPSRSTRCPP